MSRLLTDTLRYVCLQRIIDDHAYVALDYQETLTQLEDPAVFDAFSKRLQLPLNPDVGLLQSPLILLLQ